MHDLVQDPNHPLVRLWRSLQAPGGRKTSGKFAFEGIRHLARAVEENVPLQALLVAPSALQNPFGQKLVRRLKKSRGDLQFARLSDRLYRQFTLASEPQGVVGIAAQQWQMLDTIVPQPGSCWVAVESLDSPGNLGTILRTAEAAGAAGLISIDD